MLKDYNSQHITNEIRINYFHIVNLKKNDVDVYRKYESVPITDSVVRVRVYDEETSQNITESSVITINDEEVTVKSLPSGTSYTIKVTPPDGYEEINDITGKTDGEPLLDYKLIATEAPQTPFYFQALVNRTGMKLPSSLLYSTDGENWTQGTGGTKSLMKGNIIYFKGNNNSLVGAFTGLSEGDLAVGGNIMSLLYGDDYIDKTVLPTPPSAAQSDATFVKLFANSTAIVDASKLKLPATTLVYACYYGMFSGCTSLVTPPATLPAPDVDTDSYEAMFKGCTSLTKTPKLPAKTVHQTSYREMFAGCTSLTTASPIAATQIESMHSFQYMFSACTSLQTVPTIAATNMYSGACYGMFKDCTSLKTAQSIAPALRATTLAGDCYLYMFANCTSLTDAPTLPAASAVKGAYYGMFSGCTSLTGAPVIAATSMGSGACKYMFTDCTSLRNAPNLPATDIGAQSYYGMFQDCSSLTGIPTTLPATELGTGVYAYMFNHCTSLTGAPSLPAPVVSVSGYNSMFAGCTALTSAPDLPATGGSNYAFNAMFSGCTSLIGMPSILPITTLKNNIYRYMFKGCTSIRVAPELPSTALTTNCYGQMFSGCTNLNYVKAMFTKTPGTAYTGNWLAGVSPTGTFVKNSAATWNVRSANGIPEGWTVQTADS